MSHTTKEQLELDNAKLKEENSILELDNAKLRQTLENINKMSSGN
jgi:regulator of replication initiation timing